MPFFFFFFFLFFFFSLAPFGCFGYHLLSPCLRRMVTGDREAEWSLPAGCSQRRSCLPVALHKPMPSGALLTCKAVSVTSETGCSLLIAAPLLRQDRWDGFNLIIAADVEYFFFFFFLKTFTQPWKVEWAIFLFFFFSAGLFHTLLHSLSLFDAASRCLSARLSGTLRGGASNFKFIS